MNRNVTMIRKTIGALAVLWVMDVSGLATAEAAGFPTLPVRRCAPDAVVAGTICLAKYEASVWRVPNPSTTNAAPGGSTERGPGMDDHRRSQIQEERRPA